MAYAVDVSHESAMYASDSFATYAEAVKYVDEVADAWEEELGMAADRSWASPDNMYAAKVGERYVGIVRDEED
jgi:hypothetical protein